MTTTVRELKRWLSTLPDDLVVKVRQPGEDKEINSLITMEKTTGDEPKTYMAVISPNYYGG